MKRLKKLTAIILCAVLTLTAIPTAAFAQEPQETLEPYLKIVFKDYEDKDVLPNESVDLYLDYEKGNNSGCHFDWFVNGAGTGHQYESIASWEGRPGIRVTPTKHGTISVVARMFNGDNVLIARDEIEITVIDERNVFEKTFDTIGGFFKFGVAYSSLTVLWSGVLGLAVVMGIVEWPISLFNKIFKA